MTSKYYLLAIVFFFFIVCTFLGLLLLKVPLVENLFIHAGPKTYPLSDGVWLEQSFIPQRDKILGFRFIFKKVNDVEHPATIELLKKIDEKTTFTLYTSHFLSKDIASGQEYSFWLSEPLSGKGKEYWLHFAASVASESASLSPVVSLVDNYLEGKTLSSQGEVQGDILFKPTYQVKGIMFLTYYLNRIAFGKTAIFNKYVLFFFFVAWVLLLVSLLLIVFKFFRNLAEIREAFVALLFLVALLTILFYHPSNEFILMKVQL